MVRIAGELVIDRPVEQVFDFVADERNEPKYNPRIVQAHKLTDGPVGKGTRWVAIAKAGRRPVGMTMEITDYQRPHRLNSAIRMSSARIRGGLTFEPDHGQTRMRWSWELEPKGAVKLITPLLGRIGRRQERRNWAGLKHYLEQVEPAQHLTS